MTGAPARGKSHHRDPQPTMTGAFRTALLALSVVTMCLPTGTPLPLLWVAPLIGVELHLRGRRLTDAQLATLGYAWVGLSAVGVPFTGGSRSGLLPLILGGAYLAGLGGGTTGVLIESGLASGVLLGGWTFARSAVSDSAGAYLVS